ncbi:MAG: 23S rRNA (guanosine(2251)-2'-O)-methyltransferase RlmB [Chloroflexia bacterium]|nr:23S rRNA (guanosine(2251)-2'-O)-methyltransferase RlmB [Chloroflexia bacterium]
MAKDKNLIFGIRAIIEAINAGKDIEKIMIQRGLNSTLMRELHLKIKDQGIPSQNWPVERFKKWANKNHQGAIAILSEISYQNIETILPGIYESGADPFILLLDQVSDVRNFGAIARTAECAGVHAIVIPEKGSAAINADAIKASAGALLKIPVCRTKNLIDTVKLLKDNGLKVAAATEKSTDNYNSVDYNYPLAVIMGAEDAGVSAQLLKIADYLIGIPLKGTIESLNVSVATGIILFEAVKQKEAVNR